MSERRRRVPEAAARGHPGPVEERSEVAEAVRELREVRKGVRLDGLDWKQLRDKGRR